MKVGDKEVDVMKGFVLYVTTKLGNPAYTPEVCMQSIQYNIYKITYTIISHMNINA